MTSRVAWATSLLLAATTLGGLAATADPPPGTPGFEVKERIHDAQGRLVWEIGHMQGQDDLGFARHYTHKPNHGGPGGGGGGGGGGPGTDCSATQFALTGYAWTGPYSAKASSFASTLNAAANTWDAATGGSLSGGITSGSDGTAGVQDFKNQIDFVSLGASSTIAVTTTWYFISTGEAVESDGRYNTYYAWSTSGAPNAMDVANIGTHELGHTFGLDHPHGNPSKISCLTMYAYADFGETQKRTLGDGDILGIRDLYGA